MHLKQRIYIFIVSVVLLGCACALEVSVNSSPKVIPVEAEHALLTSPYGAHDQLDENIPRPALVQARIGILDPANELWLI